MFPWEFVDKMATKRRLAPVEGSAGLSLLTIPKYQCVPGQRARSKTSDLSELSSMVKFSSGVLNDPTRDPITKSYAETKANLPTLYRSPVGITRTRPPQVSARVEVNRHMPCSLHSALAEQSLPAPGRLRVNISSSTSPRREVDETSTKDNKDMSVSSPAERDSKKVWSTLKPVQKSVSRKWEEEMLLAVSSSTALYVAENCTAPLDRARVIRLAKEKHAPADKSTTEESLTTCQPTLHPAVTHGDAVHPTQHVPLHGVGVPLDLRRDTSQEVSGDDFVTELNRCLDGLQACCGGLDSTTVVFGKDLKFEKQLQRHYPLLPTEWSQEEGQGEGPKVMDTGMRYSRGHRRWISMPQVVEPHTEWLPVHTELPSTRPSTTGSSDFRDLQNSREGERVRQSCGNELLDMFEDWRLKWGLTQLEGAGEADVSEALHSPSEGVRLNALYHCAKLAMALQTAAHKHTRRRSSVRVGEGQGEGDRFSPLCVYVAPVERLLKDNSLSVRVASAVWLTVVGQWSDKLESLLLAALPSSQLSEQWLALQCLAVQGTIRPQVVDVLLSHANQSHDPARQEKAMELLARLSKHTTLVYATVSEQLNSSGWQERLAACAVLPMLHGPVTKDVCDKLVVLMWTDWSPEVRDMAAEALGKLGKGKLLHDELRQRLQTPEERVRLDALKKIVALNLMTAQLLPSFLTCFKDHHISVRIEAASVAAKLHVENHEVVDAMVSLLEDPSIKVKAHAIQCLGLLDQLHEGVLERLLWCMRFDRSEVLRAEACQAVQNLGVQSQCVIDELQSLVSLDDSELVVRVAKETLLNLGCMPKAHNQLEAQIARDIKQLTTLESVMKSNRPSKNPNAA